LILGLAGGGVALLVLVIVLVFALGGLGSRVTKANYDKLKIGMTEADQTAVMGAARDPVADAENQFNAVGGMFGGRMKIGKIGGFGIKVLEWRSGNDVIHAHIMDGKATSLMGVFMVNGKPQMEWK